MSVSPIVTLGFGSFGTVNVIPTLGFNHSAAVVVNEQPVGWASGSYVTRMSEAEFNKLRKRDKRPLITAAERIKRLSKEYQDELHKALMAETVVKTATAKLAQQKKLERIAARRIQAERAARAAEDKLIARLAERAEQEDEELIINHLIN